ncbi:major facilitator superfamily domain-containing protein 6-B-like [Hydractinia symbiolongicarpus]|uniref:major facilitator superfamily domain-containing protein 6-B-like n=1 Tax=Hydractinia symbiolongicarpus TaxID=13093 RepID=UPI00254E5C9F|nr:major facilitator superfamily domain-containing protein 6-B-like [Hydractinia symbiolongicarpus]
MKTERCLLQDENNNSIPSNKKIAIIREKTEWINFYILPAKLSCFFVAAKDSAYALHLILFLMHAGLDPAEAGAVCGLRLLGFVIGAPFWGYVADNKQAHRLISGVLCIASILLMNTQLLIAYYLGNSSTNKCPHITNHTYSNAPESDLMAPTRSTKHNQLFMSMIAINIAASFFENSLNSFVDAGVVQRIHESPKPLDYGKQRFYDGFGAASFVFISSVAPDYFPKFNITCYSAIFFVYTFVMLNLLISTQFLFSGLTFKRETKKNTVSTREILFNTLSNGRILFFFFIVLWNGAEHALYFNYTFLFLKEIGASNLLMGMCAVIAAMATTISFRFSTRIINLCGGVWKTLALCCCSYFIRYLGTAYLQNPWIVLLLQPLNGIGYGLFLATTVTHIRSVSKPAILTTMFSITQALHVGFGNILANSAGGQIYLLYGGRVLFLVGAYGAALWTCFVITYIILIRRDKYEQERNDSINKQLLEKEHITNDIGQVWYFTSL